MALTRLPASVAVSLAGDLANRLISPEETLGEDCF